jgi:hypothetical protein
MERVRQYLRPLGDTRAVHHNATRGFARNKFGPVVFLAGDDKPDVAISATQYYSWGELSAVDFRLLQRWNELPEIGSKFIPITVVEKILVESLSNAIEFLCEGLKASFPISVQLGLIEVNDYQLSVNPKYFHGEKIVGHILRDQIGDSFDLTDFESDPFKLLLPFFKTIYDAAGEVRPEIGTEGCQST